VAGTWGIEKGRAERETERQCDREKERRGGRARGRLRQDKPVEGG
jgi:hypothetical protein